ALPRQHIVMVVDNSNSMDMPPLPSDPLRLRGVAASLVLDAAELSSDVEAGLVLFDGDAQSDQKLHPPDVIRQRLDGQRLPPAGSGTNIKHALEIALSMLSGSTASIKRIVLITDGMPWPPSQQQEIIREVVPNAERAGVQIFALGLSEHIDQAFLDAVTRPTGGKTLIALQHQKLLQSAKQLMGDHDNVFTLADKALPAGTNEYKFTITAGVDRARITAILDHPRDFAPGDLTFTLDGPASAGERTYTIRPDGGDDRVAAWTAFFSTPGTYTLRIETANGHKGLRLFIEALSNLRVQATLSPPEPRHAFGSEVSVQVQAATASGTVARDALKITGTVQTPGGGTEIIAFNGLEGRFKVRDVAGRHTVVVKAQTDLARAETRVEYEAIAPEHGHLSVTPEKLEFVRPLGPSDPKIETTFKLVPEFPEGTKPRSLKVGFMLTAPSGQMELVTGGGAAIKANGPAHFTLPPAGADIIVRIKLDPHRPLPREAGRQTGEIRIFSAETAELILPLEYQVRIPAFEVEDGLES
ncbi:MAG TPA: vWA domain-containing protein, partial [Thermoanaerobaculia bacterium]